MSGLPNPPEGRRNQMGRVRPDILDQITYDPDGESLDIELTKKRSSYHL